MTHQSFLSDGTLSVSVDDVRRKIAENVRLEAQLKQNTDWLKAVETLFPGITSEDAVQNVEPKRRRRMPGGGFKEGIREAIAKEGRALEPAEVREGLEGTKYGETLKASPNYLYTTINRMLKRGELVREGSAYRLPDEATSEVEVEDHDAEDDSGAEVPRLFNLQPSGEAVTPARKVGGT